MQYEQMDSKEFYSLELHLSSFIFIIITLKNSTKMIFFLQLIMYFFDK